MGEPRELKPLDTIDHEKSMEIMKAWLERYEDGPKLVAIAIVGVRDDHSIETISNSGEHHFFSLLGALVDLQHQMFKKSDG